MKPRDVFDGLLVAFGFVAVYLELVGFGFSRQRVDTVVRALTSFEVTVYVVAGAVVAVLFLIYMLVYVPQKQAEKQAQ